MSFFKRSIQDNNSIWANLVDINNFTFTIQYLEDEQQLKNLAVDYCSLAPGERQKACGNSQHSAIAVYRINYKYQPMFNYFINSEQLFAREVIVIQEYERDKFAI
ncbi:hypothetical protein EGH82_21495 [Vibrio ponticus]|uniref:Uncharacterized protein n=1 Tax=Vibrio ponticus TaxID=265668 RepID=A0A3N3DTK9_9VIBR|nr:hypothetical protein EGH82_21495 [Vibrio ponticus]